MRFSWAMLVSGRVLQFTVEADIYDFQVWYLPFGFWVSAFPGSTATIFLGDFWLTHLDHSIVATILFLKHTNYIKVLLLMVQKSGSRSRRDI